MVFSREDMSGMHYNWNEYAQNGGGLFSGEPSRRLFDRLNGVQVLFIINFCASFIEGFDMHKARVIEWEINHHLPMDLKSEKSVFNWILNIAMQNVG